MSLSVITAPSIEPVLLSEVKRQLRITSNDQDIMLEQYMKAAREYTEAVMNRAFVQRTLEVKRDVFEDEMILPYPPLRSVSSVKYLDADGVEQTLSSTVYSVDTASEPGRVTLAYNQNWPTIRDVTDAVIIRYVAGYAGSGSPEDLRANIPENARLSILMLVAHYYRNAESTTDLKLMSVPMGYEAMLYINKNFRT